MGQPLYSNMTVGLSPSYPIFFLFLSMGSTKKKNHGNSSARFTNIKDIGCFPHVFSKKKCDTSIHLLLISVSINAHLPCINCVWPMDQWPLALAFHGSEPPFQSWCLSHGQSLVLHKPSITGYVLIASIATTWRIFQRPVYIYNGNPNLSFPNLVLVKDSITN